MRYNIEAACDFNIGRVREMNEDNFFFDNGIKDTQSASVSEPLFCSCDNRGVSCFAVFDGMGGSDDGHIASYIAAASLKRDAESLGTIDKISFNFFYSAIMNMNKAVCAEAENRKNKMGSTVVCAGFDDTGIIICNVGDSRAYHFRKGILKQISKDHVSPIPPFMKNSRNAKPPLNQCIGISEDEAVPEPYITHERIEKNDIFLLCSDGITDMLSDDEICDIILKNSSPAEIVRQLTMSALAHGGKDNITTIVIKVTDAVVHN